MCVFDRRFMLYLLGDGEFKGSKASIEHQETSLG